MASPKESKRKQLQSAQQAIRQLLSTFGYDLQDPDLRDTPKRVARLLQEEFAKGAIPKKLFRTFPSEHNQMITLIGHRTFTRCPHHLERVELVISIAYIPEGKLLGLSKLARIADYFSRGLMLQEEITEGIAEGLEKALRPKGVAVTVLGQHMCMRARGIESESSKVLTTSLKGLFFEDIKAREEFFHNLRLGGIQI